MAMMGQLYPSLNPGVTAGNPSLEWFFGSSGDLVPMIPAVSSPEELVDAEEKELRKFWRGFRMNRMFVPNWKVCLPLVQDRSSTKLCTGVWNELLRVTASSELLAPSSSF